jgi:hypothetical protein
MLNHLTPEQTAIIRDAAAPLPPADRARLEARVLEQLSQAPEIGDGTVFQVCRSVQRELWCPPTATQVAFGPEHRRP